MTRYVLGGTLNLTHLLDQSGSVSYCENGSVPVEFQTPGYSISVVFGAFPAPEIVCMCNDGQNRYLLLRFL